MKSWQSSHWPFKWWGHRPGMSCRAQLGLSIEENRQQSHLLLLHLDLSVPLCPVAFIKLGASKRQTYVFIIIIFLVDCPLYCVVISFIFPNFGLKFALSRSLLLCPDSISLERSFALRVSCCQRGFLETANRHCSLATQSVSILRPHTYPRSSFSKPQQDNLTPKVELQT